VDLDRSAAVGVGLAHRGLHVDCPVIGQDQRRLERQLLDALAAGVTSGGQRDVDPRGPGQDHAVEHGVVGQPLVGG
jgi:hypothetical protein